MVRAGAHYTDADPVALVPSCEAVDDVDALAGVEVVNGTLAVDAPDLRHDVSDVFGAHVMLLPSGLGSSGSGVLHKKCGGAEL